MDKSFLGIAGFAPLLSRFLRQKNSLRFGEKRKQGGSIRKPPFGFTVSKGFGRQYCMQSIPLAVLKQETIGISVLRRANCMQSIPLAVLKQKERVFRLSPFAIYFLLTSLRKLPEHLHARVEGLRAVVASERFAVEVGHVDVRVLHRSVACAEGMKVYSTVMSFVSR